MARVESADCPHITVEDRGTHTVTWQCRRQVHEDENHWNRLGDGIVRWKT